MRKFGKYPITINYNVHSQLKYNRQEADLHRAGQYVQERDRAIKTATSSDSVLQNNLWKDDIDQWEKTIEGCLRKIESNPVGRLVLGLLNKQYTVWINPKTAADLRACTCAQTGPLNYEIQKDGSVARGVGFGDTVINFDPTLGDDTLFHELVHAYRYSYKKFHHIKFRVSTGLLTERQSTEEFFAHQMENIYMSQAGRPITTDYTWQWVADKKKIYDFLLDNIEVMQTLKYFMRHEYLAMLAAHSFNADYNPFRDFGTLEAKFLKDNSLQALPELGAIIVNGKQQDPVGGY